MRDPRFEEPLSDATLDRAIERALDVEPSPAFVARVRQRVSSERRSPARRGWWAFGLAACVTPVLIVAVYLGGFSRTGRPADPVGPADSVAVLEPAHDIAPRAVGAPVQPPREQVVAAPRRMRPEQPASSEPVRRAAAPLRRTIVVPEIVISQAEVNAVVALTRMRLPRGEPSPVVPSDRVDGTTETRTMEMDVAELTIPPLVIEPLELTARLQGASE